MVREKDYGKQNGNSEGAQLRVKDIEMWILQMPTVSLFIKKTGEKTKPAKNN